MSRPGSAPPRGTSQRGARFAAGLFAVLFAALALGCGARASAPPAVEEDPLARGIAEARRELARWSDDAHVFRATAIEDPSGRAFAHLRASLARTARGDGSTHVIVYGGSHTAADLYPGALRRALQRGFGDLGHGFVMPVPPFEDYWQDGVRVFSSEGFTPIEPAPKHVELDTYGLAGMAFDADGPATAELETERTSASRIEVLFLAQPGGGTLRVSVDGRATTLSSSAETPRAAIETIATSDGAHHVVLEALGDGPVRLYGVAFGREGPGVVVDQLGLVGAKARHQLLWSEPVWRSLLDSRRPDLFIVSYGNNETNDAAVSVEQHAAHFEAMLARLGDGFPSASCLVLGPFDRLGVTERGAPVSSEAVVALRDALRAAAFARGCGFFDVLSWQGGPGSTARLASLDPPMVRGDGIHLTERGYRLLGAALTSALLDAVAEAPHE